MQRRRNWVTWVGLGVGVLGVTSYFVWTGLSLGPRMSALRDTALANLVVVGIGLGLSAVGVRNALGRATTYRGRWLAPVLGALNLGLAVLFVLFLFRFSALPEAKGVPPVDQAAPDFTLADHTGTPVQLASLRGSNVLLVFYRGHW